MTQKNTLKQHEGHTGKPEIGSLQVASVSLGRRKIKTVCLINVTQCELVFA